MALLHLQLFLSLFLLTIKSFNGALLLPITKDPKTLQYTTQLLIGTPRFPTKLVVDLSGGSLWVNCPPSSSSRRLVAHGSLPCSMAKSDARRTKGEFKMSPDSLPASVCDTHQENPITGAAGFGDLAEDVVTFAGIGSAATVDNFLFSCSPEYLLQGLVNGAKGVLGLGRSKIAFQSQLVNNFDFPRKFSVCLSSSDGFIISGTGISNSLSYTPLVGGSSDGYYVNVNSIKISGRRVALQPIGGVQLSSVVPYTTMKSTIYAVFTKAYVNAAASMNITTVSPVAPFGVCFRSESAVPEIELVLQSELVKWRIQRSNLMVQVSDSVMCLGVLDGGLDLNDSVVVGGYQLEDHILEFNLGTGMMGFSSSSLLMEGNSCSKIRALVSRSTESL
ncbi:hypothetical protein OSB04_014746 [Centaurea solstitialis]|uniref:Peptidase A1 domain-containing protein n=1 Tax=Centaurea solstitialis TaxID=347529 RepID=A0AA38WJG3_9ASTR|nr:hypothetical protein OSB04_014746 [Centaurea solstitialis]